MTLYQTVGFSELLVHDARLPAELRDLAEAARDGAEHASELVTQLAQATQVAEVYVGAPGGPLLDLARSAVADDRPK